MADISPIGTESLDTVVDLDLATNGVSRRDFFSKRFEAQGKTPQAFVSLGACEGGRLVGFVCCHLLQGEFGSDQLTAVLDSIAVEPGSQGHGVGHQLMQQVVEEVRQRGVTELQTQAGWTQPGVLDFFSAHGFAMAPRLILERSTHDVNF